MITTSITGANPNHGEGNNPGWTDHWTEYNTTYPFQCRFFMLHRKSQKILMLKFKKMEAPFFYQKSHLVVLKLFQRPQQKYKLNTKDRINDSNIQDSIDTNWLSGPDGQNDWSIQTTNGDGTYEKGHYANTLDSRTSDYNEPHFRNVIKYSGTMAHIHRIQTRPTSGNIVNVVPKQSSFGNDASSGYEYGTSLPKTVTGSAKLWKRPDGQNNPGLSLTINRNKKRVFIQPDDLRLHSNGRLWVNGEKTSQEPAI